MAKTYTLKDSTGKVVLTSVPDGEQEQAEKLAIALDGGIRRTLMYAMGFSRTPEVFTWEEENTSTDE